MSSHIPVLLNEVIAGLELVPGKFAIDGTVDGGGHAREIISRIHPNGTFLGLDWDKEMVTSLQGEFASSAPSIRFVHRNYAELGEVLKEEELPKADALLLDLGFSSEQLDVSGKGFSFQKDEPLTMTYDSSETPVWQLIRAISEEELANVIFEYGGERMSRRIAKAIKDVGRKDPIRTTGQLAKVVRDALPRSYEHGRIDPATRTFQALRIYANDELGNVRKILDSLIECIAPKGRIAIITFHSLEDKLVKEKFRELASANIITLITKKPITPSMDEIRSNPRSRSAKLRIAEMN